MGGVLLGLKELPPTAPGALSALSISPGERGGASPAYTPPQGTAQGVGRPEPTCDPEEAGRRPHRCPGTLTRPYVRSRTRPSVHPRRPRGGSELSRDEC